MKFERMTRESMDICLRVLKESKNVGSTATVVRNSQCIDHIPYYLLGLSRALFSDNLSRSSCIPQHYAKCTIIPGRQ